MCKQSYLRKQGSLWMVRQNKKEITARAISLLFWWTIKDSNLGPTGYEPVALTN